MNETQKEKSIIASQRNMNSVSFIFHTVKMTWPSFPQKSKYPQSVFNSIAGHEFSINIFRIENCDFIFVALWKIGFCWINCSVLSRKALRAVSQGFNSATSCFWPWTAGQSPLHPLRPQFCYSICRNEDNIVWWLQPMQNTVFGEQHWPGICAQHMLQRP